MLPLVPEPTFHPFSSDHGLALLVGTLLVGTLLFVARRSDRSERRVRALIAFLNLAAYGYSQWAWSQVERTGDRDGGI